MKLSVRISFFTLLCLALAVTSCSKKSTRTATPVIPEKDNTVQERLDEIYLKEGFINRDLYRIVIVDCEETRQETLETREEKSRKRALASLQKYISTKNITYTPKIRTELLNLINNYGKFARQDIKSEDNTVYYLEIKKNNIKGYIDSLGYGR